MSWAFAVFTYLVTWWIVWIAVLPFGAKPAATPEAGHAASAPEKPMLGQKIIATSLISAVLVAAFAGLLNSGLVPLRDVIPPDVP